MIRLISLPAKENWSVVLQWVRPEAAGFATLILVGELVG